MVLVRKKIVKLKNKIMKTQEEYLKKAKEKLQWQLNIKGQHILTYLLIIYILTTKEPIENIFSPQTTHDMIIASILFMSFIWMLISFNWKFPEDQILQYSSYLKSEDQRKVLIRKSKLENQQASIKKELEKIN
jgi:hypothetical protein